MRTEKSLPAGVCASRHRLTAPRRHSRETVVQTLTATLTLVLGFISISCSRNVTFNNPLDPINKSVPSPALLRIVSMTETGITLEWKDNINYTNSDQAKAVQMVVQVSTDGGSFKDLDTLNAFGSSGTVATVFTTNKPYYFRLIAMIDAEESPPSESVAGTVPFYSPTDLTIDAMTSTTVTLHWTCNSTFQTGFTIELSRDDITFDSVAAVAANVTSADVAGVYSSDSMYYFRVFATSPHNTSPLSNTVGQNLAGNTFTGMEFARVDGGTFLMQSPNYNVTLSTFYISKCEITEKQWRDVVLWKDQHGGSFLDANPSIFTGDSLPVENVSWQDVNAWITYLNEKEGTTKYRLPTEAEWQFAAMGGNETHGYFYSGSNNASDVAWVGSTDPNSGPERIAARQPNELGIFDMTGNVAEWCGDWYADYPNQPETNPRGPSSGQERVLRGGLWLWQPQYCGVTGRYEQYPDMKGEWGGFRVVREP